MVENVTVAIEQSLFDFQTRRIEKLKDLSVRQLIRKKNPYLFVATGIDTPEDLVSNMVNAFLSSSEETIMGNSFFEPIALAASGGRKSNSIGIDIEIDIGNIRRLISVKSGTSVFNSNSKAKQDDSFRTASRILVASNVTPDCIVGYAYGNTKFRTSSKYLFRQLAGQQFWEFLTGEPYFYKELFQRILTGHQDYAAEYREVFIDSTERMTGEIRGALSDDSGKLDWEAYLSMNSGY